MPRLPNPLLPELLLNAALEMLDERGAATFSMRELAGRIGYAVTAVYRCYEKRGHLLRVLTMRLYEVMAESTYTSEGDNTEEKLVGFGNRFIGWAVEYPGRYRLMFEHNDPEALLTAEELASVASPVRYIESLLREGQSIGEVPADQDPAALASIMFASLHGLVALTSSGRLNGHCSDVQGFFDRYSQPWFHGLLVSAAPR